MPYAALQGWISLETLELQQNLLYGTIPDAIGEMVGLGLGLGFGLGLGLGLVLYGTIPDAIGEMAGYSIP